MKKYIIRHEYRPSWNSIYDINDESQWVVTQQEIETLAQEWDVDIESLLAQVEEI